MIMAIIITLGMLIAAGSSSFSLIVGRGKVKNLPIPFSVAAVSHRYLATSHRPALQFDASNVKR
jgi:hypothetical protein